MFPRDAWQSEEGVKIKYWFDSGFVQVFRAVKGGADVWGAGGGCI